MPLKKNDKNVDVNKGQGNNNLDDFDDLDFDADLGISDLEGGEDERSPSKSKVAKDLAKESGKGFMESLIKDTAKKSLPESYSESYYDVVDYKDFIHDELYKNKNVIQTSLSKLATETKKALPIRIKLIDKILDKLIIDNEQYKRETEEQVQNTLIQSNLSSIFDKQLEFTAKLEAERNVKEEENVKREIIANKISSDLLVSINNSLNTQTAFTLQIAKEYYKKSLELQFKTYFIQADMLKTQKEHFQAFSVQFDSIVKNTGLPEFVKLRNTERLSEIVRTQATTDVYKNFMSNSDYIQNVKKKASKYVKNKVTDFTGKIDETADALSQISMAEESGEKNMLLKVMSGLAGSTAGEKVAGYISPKIKEQIKNNKTINTIGKGLETLVTSPSTLFKTLEAKADAKQEEYERDDGMLSGALAKIFGGTRDFLSVTAPDKLKTDINEKQNILEFDQAAIFDNLVYRSITDVIPMYLSKILKENTDLRKMYYITNSNRLKDFKGSEELTYDYIDRKLSTTEEFQTNVQSKLLSMKTKSKHDNLSRSVMSDFLVKKPLSDIGKKESASFLRDREGTTKTLTSYLSTAQNTLGANFSFEKAVLERDDNETLKSLIAKDPKLAKLLTIIEAEYKEKIKDKATGSITRDAYKDKFLDETSIYPIVAVTGVFAQVSKLAQDTYTNKLKPEEAAAIAELLTNFIIKESTDITEVNIEDFSAFKYLSTKYKDVNEEDIIAKLKVFRANVIRIKTTGDSLLTTSLLVQLGILNRSLKNSTDINPEVFVKLNKFSPKLFKGDLSSANLTEGRLTSTKQESFYTKEEVREKLHVTRQEKIELDKSAKSMSISEIVGSIPFVEQIKEKAGLGIAALSDFSTKVSTFKENLSKAKTPAEAIKIISQSAKDIADAVENATKSGYSALVEQSSNLGKILGTNVKTITVKHITSLKNNIDSQIGSIDVLIENEKKAHEKGIQLYKDTIKQGESSVNIPNVSLDETIEKEVAKRKKIHDVKIKVLTETKNKLNAIKNSIPDPSNISTDSLTAFRDLLAKASDAIQSYKDIYKQELDNIKK